MANSVDLPQPEGPEMETYSPFRIFSSIPASAWVSTSSVVKTLETVCNEISVLSSDATSTPSGTPQPGWNSTRKLGPIVQHLDVRSPAELGSNKFTGSNAKGYRWSGHFLAPWITARTSIVFPRTRWGIINGVPVTTSSRALPSRTA